MGLPDTETIVLSYQGKYLDNKFSENIALIVATKNDLNTIYVSIALTTWWFYVN